MNNLKNDIYNLSTKILENKSYDISDIELSALALYTILNKGYCKDAYSYIVLTKNIYDEYSLGNRRLSNIYGVTNQNISEDLISFNNNDFLFNINTELVFNNIVLSEKEKEYLIKFTDILKENKDNLINLVEDIKKLNTDIESNHFYELILKYKSDSNSTLKIIEAVTESGLTPEEWLSFLNKYKITNHKRFSERGLIFSNISEILPDNMCYKEKELISKIIKEKDPTEKYVNLIMKETLDYMNINEKDLNKFIKSSKYKNSFLEKINISMNNNLELKEKLILILDEKVKFKTNIEKLIEDLNKSINNETYEDLYLKYSKEIKLIENEVYKKYPDLLKNINETDMKFNVLDVTNDKYNNYTDYYEKNSNVIDFHFDKDTERKKLYTSLISGISMPGYFKSYHKSTENEIYFELRNSLEVIALLEIKKVKTLENRLTYDYMSNLNVIKMADFDILKREDLDINLLTSLIKEFLNKMKEEKLVVFSDILNTPKVNKSEKLKIQNILKEIEKDYKDIIFINGTPTDEDDIIMKFRYQLLLLVNNKKISFEKALEINKEITLNNKEVKKINRERYIERDEVSSGLNSIINDLQKRKPSIKI